MTSIRQRIRLWPGTVLALVFISASLAQTINPGFEDPVLPGDGDISSTIPAWSPVGGPSDSGVWNVQTGDFPAQAPEGDNVAYVFGGVVDSGISQVLTGDSGLFQEDAEYTLSVKVGNSTTFAYDGYRVQLLAGTTVLAEASDDAATGLAPLGPSPTAGTFETVTISYTYDPGDVGLVGEALEIRLLGRGLSGGSGGETEFDDVVLTAALANPVANAGGPYAVPFGGSLALDGSGSVPAAGETITAWDWDLNNDSTFGDVTGELPASISADDLIANWGMNHGENTIGLRVTGSGGDTATTTTTVTLAPPVAGQLGILDLTANGGINPNTGNPWQVGDRYRLAFYTAGKTISESNDPNFYNDFVTSEAWANPALQGSWFRAMVTINLDPTVLEADSPKWTVRENTGTTDGTGGAGVGGAGEPVYVVDGTTCIARNNADIWNSWSNPFAGDAVVRIPAGTGAATQNVHYSPFLDQNGSGDSGNVHGVSCATGCSNNGGTVRPLGNTLGGEKDLNWGSSNANNTGRVWNRFGGSTDQQYSLYAISIPLVVVDLTETVNPTVVSIEDTRGGADAILGLDTVNYTVTFSEPIDASTVDSSDFGFGGTATATIDRISGTLDPNVLELTVTPTSAGTLILQVEAGAVLEDTVGNALDTTSAIADDTTITVVEDVTAPTLVSIVDDRAGASLVVGTGSVVYTVTFDEAMDAGTVDSSDFGNAGTASLSVDLVATTEDPAVFEVTATPTTAGTLQLQIAAGAELTDLIGNPLDTSVGLPDDTTITVDPDNTAPVVDTLSPANGATGTSTGPILVATFSENIAKGTGNIEVRRTADDGLVDTIDVTSGAVTVSGGEASIALGVVLDSLVEYHVLVDPGAFTDLFGNAFAGITLKTEWGFTTGDFGLIAVTAGGQTFPALFEEYGGQSWILIGRGREGWEFDTDGQGTPGEVGLDLKDPAGFAPKALSDAIVNDLLAQAGKSFPDDVVIRLMRASTADGTGEYQELRYTNFTGFPNGNSEFTFVFDDANKFADVERVNAPAGLPDASIGSGNASIRDHQAAGNNANRIFTWDWDGHNFQQGFSMGQTVQGVDGNDPNTFLWENGTEGHAIPYTEVWLQLEVPGGGGNNFSDWIAGFPGAAADTSFDGDPDGDGNANGIENYFGTDPGVFSAGIHGVEVTGNTVSFSHPLNPMPADDVSAAYLWSEDVQTWYADGADNGSGTTVDFVQGTPSGGMVDVTATITGPVPAKLFIAAEVTQDAP